MELRLFQVLPSIAKNVDNELEIEVDYCENLRLYLENFDRVIVACPITTDARDSGLRRCRRVKDLAWQDRVRFIQLPYAYALRDFVYNYNFVRRLLRREIERAEYLIFSPHTLIGDWPTVAIREAIKLRRPYVIEADVVYEEVAKVSWDRNESWKRQLKKTVMLPLFQGVHHYCLRHSSLALFQGQDVYNAYSPFSGNPHKVYHIPISTEDYITESQLQRRVDGLNDKRPLKICYVGRAIDMKGPMDWLRTLHALLENGVALQATWIGDGSLLPRMRQMAEELGIANNVKFPGYVSDRNEILKALRDSDVFLFCHKTAESPRCLAEALASGCPLVGYGSAYPKELIAHGGGQFAALGNWKELAGIVTALNRNRQSLRALIEMASTSGRLYERDATMQKRIDLINKYLVPEDRGGQFGR
jgi:glycosyltransferase involved in cell wall biosynthesis